MIAFVRRGESLGARRLESPSQVTPSRPYTMPQARERVRPVSSRRRTPSTDAYRTAMRVLDDDGVKTGSWLLADPYNIVAGTVTRPAFYCLTVTYFHDSAPPENRCKYT